MTSDLGGGVWVADGAAVGGVEVGRALRARGDAGHAAQLVRRLGGGDPGEGGRKNKVWETLWG